MPAVNQSFDSLSFLSDGLRDMVRRRLREIAGVALVVAAMLLGAALASWSVQDPSLSHATVNPVRNLLGLPGAITADLMMQLLGLGALALVLPIAVWGWRLASHRPLRREWLRARGLDRGRAAGVRVCVLRAGEPRLAVAGRPRRRHRRRLAARRAGWPRTGSCPAWDRIVIASLAGGGALLALALACGIGWHERADDRGRRRRGDPQPPRSAPSRAPRSRSASSCMACSASNGGSPAGWCGAAPAWCRCKRNAPRVRTEPRLDEHSRATLAPEIEDEEIEEEEEEEEEDDRSRRRRSRGSPPKRRARRAAMRCLRSIS